jgi:hypothetical protein
MRYYLIALASFLGLFLVLPLIAPFSFKESFEIGLIAGSVNLLFAFAWPKPIRTTPPTN